MRLIASIILIAFLCGCAGQLPPLTTTAATCTAIKHSPPYSGKALDKAGQKPVHRYLRVTNRTLDRLGCVK